MIERIAIKQLRGIAEGELANLTPLTVLVGPNGCGKSTILEALLIGAGARPDEAVGVAVQHRWGMAHGARWLIRHGAQEGEKAEVQVWWRGGEQRDSNYEWFTDAPKEWALRLTSSGAPTPFSSIRINCHWIESGQGSTGTTFYVTFAADNRFETVARPGSKVALSSPTDLWLLDSRSRDYTRPFDALYSDAARRGLKSDVIRLLSAVIPDLADMEILTEHSVPTLYLHFSGEALPVPASLAGDGVQTLLRLTLELAGRPSGTVLLEEPEVHEHPGAIYQSARAIVAAVRRDLQVIITTHSLELIDALLGELREDELPLLSVIRLKLDAGRLKSTTIEGASVARSRSEIGDDIR